MFPLALALLPSLVQMGKSITQKRMANGLAPSNYVPPSVQDAVATSRFNAGTTTAPGYDKALNNLKTSTANTILNTKKTASNAAQLSSSAGEAQTRENQGLQEINAGNQAFQFRNREDLMKWLGIKGGYEQNNYNQYNAAKSALIGASGQNMYNAVTGAASLGLAATDKDLYSTLHPSMTLGGQPTSNSVLGGAGKPSNTVLGAAGNNSLLGKTGIDLAKAIRSRNGASFDDNEKSYLQSLGYEISPSGEVINMESPNLEVFAN